MCRQLERSPSYEPVPISHSVEVDEESPACEEQQGPSSTSATTEVSLQKQSAKIVRTDSYCVNMKPTEYTLELFDRIFNYVSFRDIDEVQKYNVDRKVMSIVRFEQEHLRVWQAGWAMSDWVWF